MMASLQWRFLDRFVVGSWHGKIGIDFFQIPRGYHNLLIGNSIFLTDINDYGPYATMYLNHPSLAVAIGPWTAPLAPRTAFWLFVVVSLGLLFLSAWLLASAFKTPGYRGFAYFAMFCSLPTYLMLWNAQAPRPAPFGHGADSQRADAVGRRAAGWKSGMAAGFNSGC